MENICPVCENHFIKNRYNKKFCSKSCVSTANGRKRLNIPISNREFFSRRRFCIICYTPFSYTINSRIYCSPKCSSRAIYLKKKNLPLQTPKRITKKISVPILNRILSISTCERGYPSCTYEGKKYLVHRLVMEQIIGRKLERWEQVHHIDGNKMNFQPDNLIISPGAHGNKLGIQPVINSSIKFLIEQGYEITKKAA